MAILDPRAYDYVSFQLQWVSDYDVKTNQTDLFKNVSNAGYLMIKANYNITIKINSSSNAALPISANTAVEFGRYKIPIRGIDNIYVSNATADLTTIQVWLAAPDEGVSTSK